VVQSQDKTKTSTRKMVQFQRPNDHVKLRSLSSPNMKSFLNDGKWWTFVFCAVSCFCNAYL